MRILLVLLSFAAARRVEYRSDLDAFSMERQNDQRRRRDGPRRRAAPAQPAAVQAPAVLYKCETVPTVNMDKYITCKRNERKPWRPSQVNAACFSLAAYMPWHCPKAKVGKVWLEKGKSCTSKKDIDGNPYDGMCVSEGHADYGKAVAFEGAVVWNRPAVLKRGKKWLKKPGYSLQQPAVSSNAIGWNPTSKRLAINKWCEVGIPPKGWSPGTCSQSGQKISVLSYNLYWWYLFGKHGGTAKWKDHATKKWMSAPRAAGRLMEKYGPFDIMGFQECGDIKRIISDARLNGQVEYHVGHNAIANAWRKDTWTSLENGYEDVSEDKVRSEWSGARGVVWSRLQHKTSKDVVFFMNHHGPLPDNSGGWCGPHATVYNILRVISERAHQGDKVILVGDFNSMGASTATDVLAQHLKNSYHGKSFDGVDKFYHNCPNEINVTRAKNWGTGGSDHDALTVFYTL